MRAVLADVDGAADVRELIALNKADRAGEAELMALRTRYPGAVTVSAFTGEGIEELTHAIERDLAEVAPIGEEISVVVPYDRGDLVSRAHADGKVLSEEFGPDGTELRAIVDPALAADLRLVTQS